MEEIKLNYAPKEDGKMDVVPERKSEKPDALDDSKAAPQAKKIYVSNVPEEIARFRKAIEAAIPLFDETSTALKQEIKTQDQFNKVKSAVQGLLSESYDKLQKLHSAIMHEYSFEAAVHTHTGGPFDHATKIHPNWDIVVEAKKKRLDLEDQVKNTANFLNAVHSKRYHDSLSKPPDKHVLAQVNWELKNDLDDLSANLVIGCYTMLTGLMRAVFAPENEAERRRMLKMVAFYETEFPCVLSDKDGKQRREKRLREIPDSGSITPTIEVEQINEQDPRCGSFGLPARVEGPPEPRVPEQVKRPKQGAMSSRVARFAKKRALHRR